MYFNNKQQADIGLYGLGVMGENLVLNMDSKGFAVSVSNRTKSKVKEFIEGRAQGKNIIGCMSEQDLYKSLKRPRKLFLMVPANVVDEVTQHFIQFLEAGDIVIDGGNSHYLDTNRRMKELESKGLFFIGTGVSGGEEGALHGPSIMPGGSKQAWPHVKDILQKISAKADGKPCCDWVGEGGAGHFVKMVHNGIEYADMQVIAEAYHMLKKLYKCDNQELHQIFKKWNQGDLESYLIEICIGILIKRDNNSEKYLLDSVLDVASQKGTGMWTVQAALEKGVALPTITEAVFSRCLSSQKDLRVCTSQNLKANLSQAPGLISKDEFVESLEKAIYSFRVVTYVQSLQLMRNVEKDFGWQLNFPGIAQMWSGGCIIRSKLLKMLRQQFEIDPALDNIMLSSFFKGKMEDNHFQWRKVVCAALFHGISVPGLSSGLCYFDGLRSQWQPANLIQAMRDCFGAHKYKRVDAPEKEFHSDWLETSKL